MTNEELLNQLNIELQIALDELTTCIECNPGWEQAQLELINSIEQEINALKNEL